MIAEMNVETNLSRPNRNMDSHLPSHNSDAEMSRRDLCLCQGWRRRRRQNHRLRLAPSIARRQPRKLIIANSLLIIIIIVIITISLIVLHATPTLARETNTSRPTRWLRRDQVKSRAEPSIVRAPYNQAAYQLTVLAPRRQLVKRQTTTTTTTTALEQVTTTEGYDVHTPAHRNNNNNNNTSIVAQDNGATGNGDGNSADPSSLATLAAGQLNQSNQMPSGPVLELSALEAARLGYLRHSIPVSVIITIAYSIVFVVGILGNSFVIAIVCKSPRMRTVTNYFIANLALADILVLLVCLPATLVGNLFIPYVLGSAICKSVSYLQGVAVSASINTMVTVTMDRFLAICFPMGWHMSRRTARWMIAGIWLFSGLIMLPWAIYFKLVPYEHQGQSIQMCSDDWPNEQWPKIFFIVANLTLQYLFPALIITICYLGIWYKIERRNIPGERAKGLKIEVIMQKSKLKVIKMMMVVVVIFLFSWAPTYLIFARIKLLESRSPWEDALIAKVMPLAQWLGASNSCINPILYTFFNRKYKRGFIELLSFTFCCRPLIRSTSSSTANGPHAHNNGQQTQLTGYHHAGHPQQRLANGTNCNNRAGGGGGGQLSGSQNGGYSMTTMTHSNGKLSQNGKSHHQKHYKLEINHSFNGADQTSCTRLDRESSIAGGAAAAAADGFGSMQINHMSVGAGKGNNLKSVSQLQLAESDTGGCGGGGGVSLVGCGKMVGDQPGGKGDIDSVSAIGLSCCSHECAQLQYPCDSNYKDNTNTNSNNNNNLVLNGAQVVGLRSERAKTFHGREREHEMDPSRHHRHHQHRHGHNHHHHKHKNNHCHTSRQHSQRAGGPSSLPLVASQVQVEEGHEHKHKRHNHNHHHHHHNHHNYNSHHHHHHHHHRHHSRHRSQIQVTTDGRATTAEMTPQAPPSATVSCSASVSLLNQWAGSNLAQIQHALDAGPSLCEPTSVPDVPAGSSHRRRAFTSTGMAPVGAARRRKSSRAAAAGCPDCCCSCQVSSSPVPVDEPREQPLAIAVAVGAAKSSQHAKVGPASQSVAVGRAGSLPASAEAVAAAASGIAASAYDAPDRQREAVSGETLAPLHCSVETAAAERSRASSLGLEIKLGGDGTRRTEIPIEGGGGSSGGGGGGGCKRQCRLRPDSGPINQSPSLRVVDQSNTEDRATLAAAPVRWRAGNEDAAHDETCATRTLDKQITNKTSGNQIKSELAVALSNTSIASNPSAGAHLGRRPTRLRTGSDGTGPDHLIYCELNERGQNHARAARPVGANGRPGIIDQVEGVCVFSEAAAAAAAAEKETNLEWPSGGQVARLL